MATNDYHFVTHWRVSASLQEVVEILSDAASLARWWPSVYLDVHVLEEGDARGVGKRVVLYTKGWLPYTLRWQFRVTEANPPSGFTIEAEGDFVGRGIWNFAQDGADVNITYDWRIEVQKPLLKHLSFLFKPIFAMNYRWAMQLGERSLRLEVARRRSLLRGRTTDLPPQGTPANPLRWIMFVLSHRGNEQAHGF